MRLILFSILWVLISPLIAQNDGVFYWKKVYQAKLDLSQGEVDSAYLHYLQAFKYGFEDEEFTNAFYSALRNRKFSEACELFRIGCEHNVFSGKREIRQLRNMVNQQELEQCGITCQNYGNLVNKKANKPRNKEMRYLNRKLSRMVLMDQLVRKLNLSYSRVDSINSTYLLKYVRENGLPCYDSLGYKGYFKIDLLMLHLSKIILVELYPYIKSSTTAGSAYLNESFAYQVSRVAEAENLFVRFDSMSNLILEPADSGKLINVRYFYTVLGETEMYSGAIKQKIVYPFDPSYTLIEISELRRLLCLDSVESYLQRTNARVLSIEEVNTLWTN